ncbi:MAG: dienelactone hydrolase family protein [Actinomycetota bacterium]
MADALTGFTESTFTADGTTRPVFSAGTGPGVIVIHEMPGLTPNVAAFGRRVVDAGFHVRMPSLFGEPGRPMSTPYVMKSLVQGCVAKEFTALALDRTSPVIGWLRALAADTHEACGGPGVGAVGMCFTGGFALGMMIDDRMRAPVLSQPSLPFPVSPARRRALGVSDADLARIEERAAAGACVLGLRFTKDPAVPAERFDTLRRVLGDRFIAVEIDSSTGNPHGIPRSAHSVLTEHFVDEPGHPTRDALDRVLTFFRDQLVV